MPVFLEAAERFGWTPPEFFHCDLMTDETGTRLAKRNDALSLRTLRAGGWTPEELRSAMHKPGIRGKSSR